MKAVLTTKYGPPEVLKFVEIDRPVPKQGEMLIKIKAIAVTSGDCRMRAFNPPSLFMGILMRIVLGVTRPRQPIQGLWLSGEIEETGHQVKKFKVSQQIYARTLTLKFGAHAEYICLPEDCIIGLKPGNLTHQEAVSIPFGGMTALYFLEKVNIKRGDKLLVYGASGSVGIAAVQLGKYFGAEVHAVCSAENTELVKSNGADYVIDYNKQNVTQMDTRFDIVFDAVGKINKAIGKKILMDEGRYVSMITSGHTQGGSKELNYLTDLVEKKYMNPVIDRCYSFENIVDAHHYVDQGHKKGNVVLIVNNQ